LGGAARPPHYLKCSSRPPTAATKDKFLAANGRHFAMSFFFSETALASFFASRDSLHSVGRVFGFADPASSKYSLPLQVTVRRPTLRDSP
jgi:hypothetical protein